MSSTNYRQYVEQTLQLARSMTIKHEATVIEINEYLKIRGDVVSDDPQTWKYYLNISGEYHPRDKTMYIFSLDTQENIVFNKENLKQNLLTNLNYRPGTSYYKDLIKRYPTQELLIRGIIDPVDMDTAIAADDFTILFMDPNYVESNETNLQNELQKRIYAYNTRWNNTAYSVTDDLYTVANLAVLFSLIPGWIINIRLRNCKTPLVHSYHVQEYLNSNGALGKYFTFLTKSQMLFLYRNIQYIERNAGKQSTFDTLREHLMDERALGLAEYKLNHNLSKVPDQLRGEPEFTRKGLNIYHRSFRTEQHTFAELLKKERPLAQRNEAVEAQTLLEDSLRIQRGRRGRYYTKALESAVVDRAEAGQIIRSKFVLDYWAYWSSIDRYNTVIEVTHPRTEEKIRLPTDHAFLLFLYAHNKSLGVNIPNIPQIRVQTIQRDPAPSFNDLRSIVDRDVISDDIVREIAKIPTVITKPRSILQFVQIVNTLYNDFIAHELLYGPKENSVERAQFQALYDHLFMDTVTAFTPAGEVYETWLGDNGYAIADLTTVEYQTLSDELVSVATGANLLGYYSTKDLQNAMVGLMTQLSSYSVQIMQETNVGPILYWGWPVARVDDKGARGDAYKRNNISSGQHNLAGVNFNHLISVKFNSVIHRSMIDIPSFSAHYELNVKTTQNELRTEYLRIDYGRVSMDVPFPND